MFRCYVGVLPLAVICWISCIGSIAHSFVIGAGGGDGTATTRSVAIRMSTTASNTETQVIPVIQGIRDIVDDYDVFLLDMWYVSNVTTACVSLSVKSSRSL